MTTTVKIEAHCSDNEEVHVTLTDTGLAETSVLQNGETKEIYAYGSRIITVKEINK